MRYSLLFVDSVPPVAPRSGDAGYDLPLYGDVTIGPNEMKNVNVGFALEVPDNHAGIVLGRSGNAFKRRLFVLHNGLIDSSYRGDIGVLLYNASNEVINLKHGDKIAQLIVIEVKTPRLEDARDLSTSDRGTDGFGSTGLAGIMNTIFEDYT